MMSNADNYSVAVLITYFNEKELLGDCLRSLDQQISYRPDEVIVYDDASRYPARDYIPDNLKLNLRVIEGKVNIGLGSARNRLMEASDCEYIHHHDADDLFSPRWCKSILEAIKDSQPDIIITDADKVDSQLNILKSNLLGLHRLLEHQDLIAFCIDGAVLPICTTIRRDRALKINGYTSRDILPTASDFEFHIRFASQGVRFVAIPEPLVVYRALQGGSMSRNADNTPRSICWTSGITAVRLLQDVVPITHKDHLAERCSFFASQLFSSGQTEEAAQGVELAKSIGRARHLNRNAFFGMIAGAFGQAAAERSGAVYRKILPKRMRKLIASLTSPLKG